MGLREPFNTWTHGLGVLAAVAGLVYLVGWQAEGARAVVAYTIYGSALIVLFLASTLYHALPVGDRGVRLLRRFDHSAIYLLIAGTYTPVCLLAVSPAWGWSIFGVVWGLAVVGILGRNVWPSMPKWLYTSLYVVLGWTALVGVKPLTDTFPVTALAWLLAGGIAYTIGTVVYARGWLDLWPRHIGSHGVWHLFVLTGSVLHFVFIATYV